MVRIKNRYLLVNILYPKLECKSSSNGKIPDFVEFNQPTTNALTAQALLKGIRSEVVTQFGDFGSGAIADSLSVKYLSTATSTLILRVSRAHYKIVWAALSLMTCLPLTNGKNCVYQVVRVSGTIRKAEDEAVRRARDLVLKARREAEKRGDSTLDNIFGKDGNPIATGPADDVLMVDKSDGEEDEELSDGDG